MIDPAKANHARYLPGQRAGHYESWFQRANHPSRPLAFWIRYTIFAPEGRPADAKGELWAIFFDGETGQHVAAKREVPIAEARFDRDAFDVRVADAHLRPGALAGSAASRGHRIAWDLRYEDGLAPLLFLPPALYEARLPRAKALVGVPLCTYEGSIDVDGRRVDLAGWLGSQNHNWGSRHTDHYAWGQVAGFDASPTTFLEIATARLKLGPVWTPFMTLAVLRHDGQEIRANGPASIARARAHFADFAWSFSFEAPEARVEGSITAPSGDFVGLAYGNPPGGVKQCLNTKIASCHVKVSHRGGKVEELEARRRAAFEILQDDAGHGVPMLA
jgi:hypothetical protein